MESSLSQACRAQAAAMTREGDTYPWLVDKVVCLTRCVVVREKKGGLGPDIVAVAVRYSRKWLEIQFVRSGGARPPKVLALLRVAAALKINLEDTWLLVRRLTSRPTQNFDHTLHLHVRFSHSFVIAFHTTTTHHGTARPTPGRALPSHANATRPTTHPRTDSPNASPTRR